MKLTFYCQSCSQKLNVGHSQIGSIVRCPACDMAQPVTTPLAKRYYGMRIASVTLQIAGVVVGLALIVGVLFLMARYQLWDSRQLGNALLVLGVGLPVSFAVGVVIFAAGEWLRLMVELEDNVRTTRLHMDLARAEREALTASLASPPPPTQSLPPPTTATVVMQPTAPATVAVPAPPTPAAPAS
jgi:hypothetical protein